MDEKTIRRFFYGVFVVMFTCVNIIYTSSSDSIKVIDRSANLSHENFKALTVRGTLNANNVNVTDSLVAQASATLTDCKLGAGSISSTGKLKNVTIMKELIAAASLSAQDFRASYLHVGSTATLIRGKFGNANLKASATIEDVEIDEELKVGSTLHALLLRASSLQAHASATLTDCELGSALIGSTAILKNVVITDFLKAIASLSAQDFSASDLFVGSTATLTRGLLRSAQLKASASIKDVTIVNDCVVGSSLHAEDFTVSSLQVGASATLGWVKILGESTINSHITAEHSSFGGLLRLGCGNGSIVKQSQTMKTINGRVVSQAIVSNGDLIEHEMINGHVVSNTTVIQKKPHELINCTTADIVVRPAPVTVNSFVEEPENGICGGFFSALFARIWPPAPKPVVQPQEIFDEIILRGNTVVNGSLTFESGKGRVLLYDQSQVLGGVNGGEVVRK